MSLPQNHPRLRPLATTIQIFHDDKTKAATIDTGGSVSLVSTDQIPGYPLFPSPVTVTGCDSYIIKILGYALVDFSINGVQVKYPLFVTPDNTIGFLLGADFAEHFLPTIDYRHRKITSSAFGDIKFSSPPQNILREIGLDKYV